MPTASGSLRALPRWFVSTRPGNVAGAALGVLSSVLLAAVILVDPAVPLAVWAVLPSVPVFVSFVLLTFVATGPTREGVGAGTVAYLLSGAAYVIVRLGIPVATYVLLVLVWPSVLLWQDACVLGLWPCPGG